jgi:hypothetical protein
MLSIALGAADELQVLHLSEQCRDRTVAIFWCNIECIAHGALDGCLIHRAFHRIPNRARREVKSDIFAAFDVDHDIGIFDFRADPFIAANPELTAHATIFLLSYFHVGWAPNIGRMTRQAIGRAVDVAFAGSEGPVRSRNVGLDHL